MYCKLPVEYERIMKFESLLHSRDLLLRDDILCILFKLCKNVKIVNLYRNFFLYFLIYNIDLKTSGQ